MPGAAETVLVLGGVALVHLAGAATPGPSFLVVARAAASGRRGAAVLMALGMGLGAAAWAAAAVLGLALAFRAAPLAWDALRLAGAAFLIWLSVMMWRHAETPLDADAPAAPLAAGAALRHGLLVQLSNPKVMIFFGSVFVGVVPPEAPGWMIAAILADVLAVEAGWYVLVAQVFSARRVREGYVRLKALIDRVCGGALGLLGLRLALG